MLHSKPTVDFTIGSWRFGPRFRDSNNPPPPPGKGDLFVKQNLVLFAGCGCKQDLVPVLNRWTNPTEKQVETVARTLHNKNQTIPFNDILKLLTEFVEENYQ